GMGIGQGGAYFGSETEDLGLRERTVTLETGRQGVGKEIHDVVGKVVRVTDVQDSHDAGVFQLRRHSGFVSEARFKSFVARIPRPEHLQSYGVAVLVACGEDPGEAALS